MDAEIQSELDAEDERGRAEVKRAKRRLIGPAVFVVAAGVFTVFAYGISSKPAASMAQACSYAADIGTQYGSEVGTLDAMNPDSRSTNAVFYAEHGAQLMAWGGVLSSEKAGAGRVFEDSGRDMGRAGEALSSLDTVNVATLQAATDALADMNGSLCKLTDACAG